MAGVGKSKGTCSRTPRRKQSVFTTKGSKWPLDEGGTGSRSILREVLSVMALEFPSPICFGSAPIGYCPTPPRALVSTLLVHQRTEWQTTARGFRHSRAD